ncbi:uncharacterized protein (TIGR02453 family) [Wenyingzhuangia heitensis]|uniref:Uncharacterized protein (TIGR02453 family) n=1 Tax=Wenyingzhuangia heitensis TaxID=1487859 RepID=A0ABX0UA17_9FLAO|nr:DUF2461 domain-containing protein [Wenyingzhuangia heitensis]NIJ45093.1 uncharacterized protein (TIGR02453 family) [Wenyingzhuangia heitensis]
MSIAIQPSIFQFLNALKENNNREWFADNKAWFVGEEEKLKTFFTNVMEGLKEEDDIEDMKAYRIYRDVRFSKDKSPYKVYRSCSYKRATEALRGGYHVEITPGGSFLACGFWQPNKEDLLRIRKEFELDASEINEIINSVAVQKTFGGFYKGEALKTAPKGFDKEHKSIALIRKKDFMLLRKFTDAEVLSEDFYGQILQSFKIAKPFLDYMSDVLTTNLNGESTI